jgi:glycosyltransferase involved in cell wall biosynthesis
VDATVVIPTHDRASLLALTLARLLPQLGDGARREVIVVDDGSPNERTAELVAALAHPALSLVRQTRTGAAAARNPAIERARGRVLIFLDDDAFVGPHFVDRHLALHDERRPALVAGGIVQVRDVPDAIDEAPGLRAYHRHPMPGGNSSAPTEAVRSVGGYDPWFSSYGWHDQELAERLLRAGLRRRFAWGAPIYHYKAPSYDVDLRAQLARERERGRMGARFYHKHRRPTVGITTKPSPTVRAVVAAAARATGAARLAARVEAGEVDGRSVSGWRASVLRAWVESTSGARELTRLAGGRPEPAAPSE